MPALRLTGALLAIAALATPVALRDATGATAAGSPSGCAYRERSTSVRHGPAGARAVALTFDDGPSAYTARILAILRREHVRATFFVQGDHVAGHEALLRRMLADGHLLGNHSFTHADLSPGDAGALSEIDRTQHAIAAATGFTPCLLRPPYGRSSKRLLAALRPRRLTSTLWSVNPQDYRTPGTAAIERRVPARVAPGAIVLLHDGGGDRTQTVHAVTRIIRALKARGYRFVTVAQLLRLRVRR